MYQYQSAFMWIVLAIAIIVTMIIMTNNRVSWELWGPVVVVTIVAVLGVLIMDSSSNWYNSLVKPRAQPPGWVFGIMWTVLYLALMFVWVWYNVNGTHINSVWLWMSLTLIFGLLWVVVFSVFRSLWGGVILIILAFLTALPLFYYFAGSWVALLIILLYVLWLAFATGLSIYLAANN